MRQLHLDGSNYTPQIVFNPDGNLSITGKSLPEDTAKFYEPVLNWIIECDIDSLNITIKLDYMNSSSAHQISKLLIYAKDNPNVKDCNINWYYDTEDEDNLDFGKELEYMTDFNFRFLEYSVLSA
jgi:hypothetical protein